MDGSLTLVVLAIRGFAFHLVASSFSMSGLYLVDFFLWAVLVNLLWQ